MRLCRDDDDDGADWNLRKCSASALDKLSITYKDSLLPILFPLLQAKLSDLENWKVRESAILALGAVAEGCYTGLVPHLNQLVSYLIKLLSDIKVCLVHNDCVFHDFVFDGLFVFVLFFCVLALDSQYHVLDIKSI